MLRVVVSLAAAAALPALLSAAPARAQIFQPGTQPIGEDGGIEIPIQGSQQCLTCHGEYDDGGDHEPWDTWRGAMMGNAGRDPVFRAALAVAEADHPDAADFCLRCHSMPAWLRGRSTLDEWSEADGSRLTPDEAGFPSNDLDGVACMVCHRATEPPDPSLLGNARIFFLDGDEGDVRLGPYDYSDGSTPPEHDHGTSEFLASGSFCGQCHDISNPVLQGRRLDGSATGRPFAIERTYSEWAHSAFAERGETCQDCHMPEVDTPVRAADLGEERDYFRRHDLAGGSVWQPLAIAADFPDRRGRITGALERASERARSMLEGAAELTVTEHAMEGEVVTATVRVENLTGHKLPTGYPEGRRMWLEVAVIDGAGDVVAGSGLYDPDTAELARDAQLRTYETKLGQGTEPSFHFILNDTVLEDTRIPPEGFDPPADRDMTPVGRDYGDGDGGYRHWDEVSYTLPACGTGEVTLRARLRYQATTREYIEFLRDTAPDSLDPDVGNWGEIAYGAWLAHGGDQPVDVAEVTVALGDSPCEPADAGVPADGGASDGGPHAGDDDGCGCIAVGAVPRDGADGAWTVALLGLALALRRGLTARRASARPRA